MKRIIAALLTFTIGILGFDLLETKEPYVLKISPSEQVLIKSPTYQTEIYSYENFTPEKVENSKPFFESFGESKYDEESGYQGYGGWFIADDFKGMPEVWTILLARDSDEKSKDEKMVWTAMILTVDAEGNPNDDDDFHSVQIKTVGNRLSFKTNKIRGIEYKFDGEFFVNGKDFPEEKNVLRGTMQKIVKGKQIAKFTADFAYHEPQCYH